MNWELQSANALIAEWIPRASRVLDLGCGNGDLLALLTDSREVDGIGVEISQEQVALCIERGLRVIQDDIERGLQLFSPDAFDCLVLSRTLQEMHDPAKLLQDMLHIGQRAIISIDNAGHLRRRLAFLLGRLPPDEHGIGTRLERLITVADFERLCEQARLRIVQKRYLTKHGRTSWPLLAEAAVYQLELDS